MKNFGFSFVSYWGDQIEDIPCQHTIFLPDLVLALDKLGYKVYSMQEDLDKGKPRFQNYKVEERQKTYNMIEFTDTFPELDILLIEWRWKIPGRNWYRDGIDTSGLFPPMMDYIRQTQLLDHYTNTNTKVFILDTDYKLTKEDEEKYPTAILLDLATNSKQLSRPRHGVFWPFNMDQLKEREYLVHAPYSFDQDNTYSLDPTYFLSYIGNDYERDAQFEKYIHQIAKKLPFGMVHVYGNWIKYPKKAQENWKKYFPIVFHPKVTKAHMEYIYSRSYCVPLLAKDDYAKHGQIAYRYLESMYNGTIPVGFKEFCGIEKYLIPELIVGTTDEFMVLIEKLDQQTHQERINLWKKQVNHFHYNAEEFVHELERLS